MHQKDDLESTSLKFASLGLCEAACALVIFRTESVSSRLTAAESLRLAEDSKGQLT